MWVKFFQSVDPTSGKLFTIMKTGCNGWLKMYMFVWCLWVYHYGWLLNCMYVCTYVLMFILKIDWVYDIKTVKGFKLPIYFPYFLPWPLPQVVFGLANQLPPRLSVFSFSFNDLHLPHISQPLVVPTLLRSS